MTELLDPQSEWAQLLLSSLASAGVTEVVLSPGSRSTPFVLAAAADSRLHLTTIVDERSAGFFALGQAKASGRPSLLLCTSGSAPAHYLPAILEARATRTPLVVLSADRPLEAQAAGAPQTIDQLKLFGDAVLAFYELGGADASPPALRGLRRLCAQAVALPGPVHLNARARKPLEPRPPEGELERAQSAAIAAFRAQSGPRIHPALSGPDPDALDRLATMISDEPEGIIAVGPRAPTDAPLGEALVELARRAGYPIIADATAAAGAPEAITGGFALLAVSPSVRARLKPRHVLQIGPMPVASGYGQLLAEATPRLSILSIDASVDAESRADAVHLGDPGTACAILVERLRARGLSRGETAPYAAAWREAHAVAKTTVLPDESSEVGLVKGLLEAMADLRPSPTLVIGNSLPVRHLDLACALGAAVPARVVHQRGTSGIDGLVSGAAGVASVTGPTVLCLGDLSLQHDLHGVLVAAVTRAPLVIAVVNNGGGRIFETLPIGRRADLREALPWFTTPSAPDVAALARFAGLRHMAVRRASELAAALASGLSHPGATVLELEVAPGDAAAFERSLAGRVEAALSRES